MTLLGKLLVFINLACSMLLATWGVGLYTTRIDWSNNPAKEGQPAGAEVERKAQLAVLQPNLASAEAAWREARTAPITTSRPGLLPLEDLRDADRLWYVDELEFLRTGPVTADKPIRSVVFANGLPVPDPANANRPKMVPATDRFDKPLLSLNAYAQELENLRKQLADILQQIAKLVTDDTDLTLKLTGPEGMPQKGLQGQLKFERTVKLVGVVEEQALTRPQLINAVVDSELILKRQKELEKRIKELEKTGVAAEKP